MDIKIVGLIDECDECKEIKAIYKHNLCEECYTDLFKEEEE